METVVTMVEMMVEMVVKMVVESGLTMVEVVGILVYMIKHLVEAGRGCSSLGFYLGRGCH